MYVNGIEDVGLMVDWGFDDFRDRQLEICTEVMKGNDVFVNAPTGLGKSYVNDLSMRDS